MRCRFKVVIATTSKPPIRVMIASDVLFDEFYNPNLESNQLILTEGRAFDGVMIDRLLGAGGLAAVQHVLHEQRSGSVYLQRLYPHHVV